MERGHTHPLTLVIRDLNAVFTDLGFSFAEGPELESEDFNFDYLNIPKDHPARDMQDTFYVEGKPGHVLRTHTSPVQIRYMKSKSEEGIEPPYRIIVPGKVFRNEATDATHEAQFYQIEGLMVGKDVSLGTLKGVLAEVFSRFFGATLRFAFVRASLRSSNRELKSICGSPERTCQKSFADGGLK